ncbi:hypothetical protein J6590_073163 [Homalodisca vitripennis]|nr:hypothetical protein J6590_073163 [Homalodisca vitripennis]
MREFRSDDVVRSSSLDGKIIQSYLQNWVRNPPTYPSRTGFTYQVLTSFNLDVRTEASKDQGHALLWCCECCDVFLTPVVRGWKRWRQQELSPRPRTLASYHIWAIRKHEELKGQSEVLGVGPTTRVVHIFISGPPGSRRQEA